jgi:probable HAF family extracellular repeat protein
VNCTALNSAGKIIGYTTTIEHGFAIINGKMTDLNGLIKKAVFEINEGALN